jgi:glutamine amidotransferase
VIAIIDYRAGNLTSVRLAFECLKRDAVITDDPDIIRNAERVIFPGVGAIEASMASLRSLGLDTVIPEVVASGKPFMGICIGMQILLGHSEENGGVDSLGIVPGRVKRFCPSSPYDKVPQMGWNAVTQTRPHPIFNGITDGSEFYFVHSYYPAPADEAVQIGATDYADVTFTSALARGNLVATQFHPEKSGKVGLRMLENFCNWNGEEA